MLGQNPRHLAALQGSHLLNGNWTIPFLWEVQTVTGTTTYNMFDANGFLDDGGLAFKVKNAYGVVTGGAGAGTIVINRLASDGTTATAITDVGNIVGLGLADTELFDFSEIDDAAMEVTRGLNLQIVTTGNCLALVTVECAWTA